MPTCKRELIRSKIRAKFAKLLEQNEERERSRRAGGDDRRELEQELVR